MFVPDFLDARSNLQVGPQGCRPFTLQSSVCVGDLITILSFSISGIGFFFWGIHAIRKMRTEFPFTYKPEDDMIDYEEPIEENGITPFHVPSASDYPRGIAETLALPERAATRLALSRPGEPSYTLLPPIVTDSTLVVTPRMPPPAGGQSHGSSSFRSSRHESPLRGGHGVDDEHFGNISPSRARDPLPRRSGSNHMAFERKGKEGEGRIDPEPVPYSHYYTLL